MKIETIVNEFINDIKSDDTVKIWCGHGDEFYMDAYNGPCPNFVWIQYRIGEHTSQEKVIAKFKDIEDSVKFADELKTEIEKRGIKTWLI